MCLGVCVWRERAVGVTTCRSQIWGCDIFLNSFPIGYFSFLRNNLSLNLCITISIRLRWSGTLESTCFSLLFLGFTGMCLPAWLLHGHWGSELRFSSLLMVSTVPTVLFLQLHPILSKVDASCYMYAHSDELSYSVLQLIPAWASKAYL